MEPIELKDPSSGSVARIAPHLGFNCYDFVAAVTKPGGEETRVSVIDASPEFIQGGERPSGHGIPILFPYPNRIREARYEWDGRDYELSASLVSHDAAGNAIHGFCLDRPWRVVEQTEQAVLGEFQLSLDAPERLSLWPCDFCIQIRYEVRGATLQCDVTILNPGDVPLPWGFGTHPYFRLPLSEQSDLTSCRVQVPAAEEWELDQCLPTGARRSVPAEKDLRDWESVDGLVLDDVLTGLEILSCQSECGISDETAGLEVIQTCDGVFREMVVYTPPGRPAVCLEPYTCVTDAINLEHRGYNTGLRLLLPGERFQTWFHIRAAAVVE